jgi:hypothetical protein
MEDKATRLRAPAIALNEKAGQIGPAFVFAVFGFSLQKRKRPCGFPQGPGEKSCC